MRARKIGGALPATAGLWLWTGTARAAAAMPGLTPEDNLGLLALISGLLAFWFYLRVAVSDPQ